ncbi:MAG: hypothetical protein M1823_000032 [Watsoniomyces obsoletus]|nr:MAG: hypothetical protein M1823_000032 [Watsoniomyces obsoletus]
MATGGDAAARGRGGNLPRTPSPTKRRRLVIEEEEQVLETIDDTPRATATTTTVFRVQSRAAATAVDPSDAISSEQTSSRSTTTTSSSRRTGSPKKVQFSFAQERIQGLVFPADAADKLPEALAGMITKIESYARGLGVIPDTFKGEGRVVRKQADETWQPSDDAPVKGLPRANDVAYTDQLPDTFPTPRDCEPILYHARLCDEGNASEAAWNSSVHDRVLTAALWSFRLRVYFSNCTTAKIGPNRFIPLLSEGTHLGAKMVDFVLNIEPSTELDDKIYRWGLGKEDISINQTLYTPLWNRPIGVNIETKRPGEDLLDAQRKLQIWCAAQFARMEDLVDWHRQRGNGVEELTLPFIPCICVQGHIWHFAAALRDTPNRKTILYRYLPIGDTRSLLGLYQIICTLQLLASWMDTKLLPWYEKVLSDD